MPRREDHPSPGELRREAKQDDEHGGEIHGKRASNVAGGKKAAATRKEHKSGSHRSRSSSDED